MIKMKGTKKAKTTSEEPKIVKMMLRNGAKAKARIRLKRHNKKISSQKSTKVFFKIGKKYFTADPLT